MFCIEKVPVPVGIWGHFSTPSSQVALGGGALKSLAKPVVDQENISRKSTNLGLVLEVTKPQFIKPVIQAPGEERGGVRVSVEAARKEGGMGEASQGGCRT